MTKKPNNSTFEAARQFNRRLFLKRAAAATATVAVTGPFVARTALSSSGELHMMTWAGFDFSKIKAAFETETGIKLVIHEFPDEDKMVAQLMANNGEGFDLCEPASNRTRQWIEHELLQPIDEAKSGLSGIEDTIANGNSAKDAMKDGKRYSIPTIWGTEAIAFNKDEAPLSYGTASYRDLYQEGFSGRMTCRPHSFLLSTGLVLEAEGKLPHTMRDAFGDEAKMVANYDLILPEALKYRKNIAQFWSDENSAQGAFRVNGCVIGQIWDTSAGSLRKEGLPIGYVVPKERALTWQQNFVMPAKAKNAEQAYAWLKWFCTPQGTAAWATIYSANPVGKGAAAHLDDATKATFAEIYPGDALSYLWWWPAQSSWFVSKRNEYADKFKSAS